MLVCRIAREVSDAPLLPRPLRITASAAQLPRLPLRVLEAELLLLPSGLAAVASSSKLTYVHAVARSRSETEQNPTAIGSSFDPFEVLTSSPVSNA